MNTHSSWALVLFATVGCGGAPFSTVDIIDPLPEAAAFVEAGEEAPVADAGVFSEASPEASAEGAPVDATCVPMPDAHVVLGGCFGSIARPGVYPEVVIDSQHPDGACVTQMTPTACQCIETYNCACLAQTPETACAGSGVWKGCAMQNGVPYVTCSQP